MAVAKMLRELIAPVLNLLDRENPGDVVGLYLYGSAVASSLRWGSDIDLLMLTRRSLGVPERGALVSLLLSVSAWHGHAERFPDASHGRPIELTSVVIDQIQPWSDRVRLDFQYGEWLRGDLTTGRIPQPADDPDIVTLLASAFTAHRVLRGAELGDVVAPVPPDLLRRSVLAVIPDILAQIEGDERNTLLALARILVTVETGRILAKDEAVDAVAPTLTGPDRDLLQRARAGYLDRAADNWTGLTPHVISLAHKLADRAVG
jgi:Domain of unknown function (DUF4111)